MLDLNSDIYLGTNKVYEDHVSFKEKENITLTLSLKNN